MRQIFYSIIFTLAITAQASPITLLQQYNSDKRLSDITAAESYLDENNDVLIMIEYLEDLKKEPESKASTQLVHQIINRSKNFYSEPAQMLIYVICASLPHIAASDIEAIIQEAMLSDCEQDKAEIYLQYLKYPHAKAEIIKQLIKDVGKFSDSEQANDIKSVYKKKYRGKRKTRITASKH